MCSMGFLPLFLLQPKMLPFSFFLLKFDSLSASYSKMICSRVHITLGILKEHIYISKSSNPFAGIYYEGWMQDEGR
uniref:Uncharacterized protein n=1 Tax=Arundo donax TaxID=35708 RepID=A0A0A8XSM2_ARUDO